jgi:hypothetical protein
MDFDYKLSNAEMREAFWMNQTWRTWFGPLGRRLHVLVFVAAAAMGVMLNHVQHQHSRLGNVAILIGPEALVMAVYWWRIAHRVADMTARVNKATKRISLDASGIKALSRSESMTCLPWSHYQFWKEGKLVFTLGNGKTFRTIPKRGMSEVELSALRGILQSHIR